MGQCARGLVAVLASAALASGAAGGAVAAPSEEEVAAIYAVREELVEALRDTKTEIVQLKAYRDEPRWYIVDESIYLDLVRLGDYVPIARYLEDRPGSFDVLRGELFWLDAPLTTAVSELIDEADSSGDVDRAAWTLATLPVQAADEKAALVRSLLRYLREERELTITAIDTLDTVIEALPAPVPGPRADDVVAEPLPVPGDGPAGVLAAFRDELEARLSFARGRIQDCRAWIDDPDAYIDPGFDAVGFDLSTLADYRTAVEFIRDHAGAWTIFDAPAGEQSDLDIATRLYLGTFERVPDDLARVTGDVVRANRQTSKEKREACAETIGYGKRYRDAILASMELTDVMARDLGLDLSPTPPQATAEPLVEPTNEPTPPPTTAPTPDPTPPPTPSPTPTLRPAESAPPNPFWDT